MRTKAEVISALQNPGVIAVVRARSEAQVLPLTEALLAGGILAVEITMTTPNALVAIQRASAAFGDRALIGVGTVLAAADCGQALAAGAQFVVSPITRPEIVKAAHAADRPVMLGAFTPTEAQLAHEAGADFIKLFPADILGPAGVKAIRAPLPHLKIVPTGGVDLQTIPEFYQAGCAAVGAGSALITSRILAENDWPELTRQARLFVRAALDAQTARRAGAL